MELIIRYNAYCEIIAGINRVITELDVSVYLAPPSSVFTTGESVQVESSAGSTWAARVPNDCEHDRMTIGEQVLICFSNL